MELLDFNSIIGHKDHIIFRKPVNEGNQWFSEAIYKNSRLGKKLITRTPRMKIFYSAKKIGESTTFCISFCDRDINDDVQDYYKFVNFIDKTSEEKFVELNREYKITGKGQVTLKHSLCRKSRNHSYYMKVKLLEETNQDKDKDKDKVILTKINKDNRNEACFEDIKYNFYVEQYLEFCGIWGDTVKKIIKPIWISHQIVISKHERQFLSKLLLDDISPYESIPAPISKKKKTLDEILKNSIKKAPPRPPPPRSPPVTIKKEAPKKEAPVRFMFSITPNQINNIKSGLKKVDKSKLG